MASGMTSSMMLTALCDVLRDMFKDKRFTGQEGKKRIKVYEWELPISTDNDEDVDTDDAAAPFIIVSLESGTINSPDETQIVNAIMTICCYDDGTERLGYKEVNNIKEDIVQRFCKTRYFGGWFTILMDEYHPIDWAMQKDPTDPYYYGAVSMWVTIPAMTQEQDERIGSLV